MTIRFKKMIPLPMLEQDTAGSEVWEADSLLLEQGKTYVVEAPSGRGKQAFFRSFMVFVPTTRELSP